MIAPTLESSPTDDPSLADVIARLGELETRVRLAVARRRADDPEPDDPFRGLYLSDDAVERVLASGGDLRGRSTRLQFAGDAGREAGAPEADGVVLRLRRLGLVFSLDDRDLDLLLIAIAPDLDARFERLYGYLNDDVSRRRATVGLSLELAGLSSIDGGARWRLSPAGPLISGGLLLVEDVERPVLSRSLRVPDRVTSHVLGLDVIEPDLRDVLGEAGPPIELARSEALERALRRGVWPIQVRETGMASGVATAVASIAALGAASLTIDLGRVVTSDRAEDLIAAAVREARLQGAVLVASGIEAIASRAPRLIARVVEAACPVVIVGGQTWDPTWSSAVPVHLDAPAPAGGDRRSVWQLALESEADLVTPHGHPDPLLDATDAFKLTAPQVHRATRSAHLRALIDERSIQAGDLQAGARAQNGAGLERLARRVEPRAGWDDLVLPSETRTQLEELEIRVRHRERVLDDWGFGARSTRGRGMTVLFSGESGTGKTLAAEVIAARLGLDLYVIDLSTVVDKYIGETEKNLDRIFAEADRINGVLLFDEADAIFGKRSEVRDARDRYANLEVAYLLQRMERFDGLAVLTTNLRANLDDAFTRRLDVIVDFPMPEAASREALWRMHLPDSLPRADDLDLEFMARRFRLSGGHIRNVCVTAAYLGADADQPVTMADLIRATEREYRKLGRLTVEAEFGPYHALITSPTGA